MSPHTCQLCVRSIQLAQKGNQKMRPSPVARTMKPCECASTGRVRLKAHPVPQPKPRDPSRGPQAADPSITCRQERASTSQTSAAKRRLYAALALRTVDVPTVSGRRDGCGKARKVARMDSGQFAASTGTCCQRTPEPSRVVVRLHRTTDPPRAHLWPTFLCEEKEPVLGLDPGMGRRAAARRNDLRIWR